MVIIDEATQAKEPSNIIPLVKLNAASPQFSLVLGNAKVCDEAPGPLKLFVPTPW
jgi:hypothetical protein